MMMWDHAGRQGCSEGLKRITSVNFDHNQAWTDQLTWRNHNLVSPSADPHEPWFILDIISKYLEDRSK